MTLEIATHKSILVQILKDIYTDAKISPFLGFKGGTAAVFFYGLSRFSVDLDFDLLDPELEDIVFERLKNILNEYGLVKDARKKRYSLFFLLSYNNKIQNAYNVKIEVNRRDFGSKYEVKSYLGISMKVMIRQDMAAHKLVAMFERMGKTNRDIFDVWFFLKNNWPINEEIIEKRTNLSVEQFFKKCIGMLEGISDRGILSGIGELLDAKQKTWVKEKLRSETIFLLKLRMTSLKGNL
ncbi:nucleotidyl transferase AbiEii/AbiGii toxin family protein [Candidatus Babeliales bacterium]|nr:nucleotidyl transferase AbiEii/AbiGii toxin family protein [Candidatus Babeliales bacterium]